MSDKFRYSEMASEVLEEFNQDADFQRRFEKFCQNAMEGKAEKKDIERLIRNVNIDEED